jgi:RNA polymerase sigma factor (sigma-70 family)
MTPGTWGGTGSAGIPPLPPAQAGNQLRDEILRVMPAVRRYAMASSMRYGASRADAEDAAQDTLESLWRAMRSDGVPRDPVAWATVVARRRTWALARASGRERPVTDRDLVALAGPSVGGDDAADALAERDQVLSWIERLPPQQRAVMKLAVAGYGTREVAEILGIPVSVARARLHAAREVCRRAFVAQLDADREEEEAQQRATRGRVAQAPGSRAPAPPADEPADLRDLAGLPPRQREVLRLSRRGYKPAQIARLLGMSANTARVNLYHARKRVRQGQPG